MCVSLLTGESECDDYSVLLANIQFQVTFVYILYQAIVLGKGVLSSEMNHNQNFESEICGIKIIEWALEIKWSRWGNCDTER